MEFFEQNFIKICRLHLLFFGVWPHQKQIIAIVARICTLILCIHNCIAELCSMIKSRNNIYVIMETVPFFMSITVTIARYIHDCIRLKMFKEMLDRMQYDWHCATMNEEVHILEACMKDGWKRSLYYLVSMYIVSTVYGFTYITLGVLQNWIPLNTTIVLQPAREGSYFDQDEKLSLILVYRYTCVAVDCITTVAAFLQFSMLSSHACGIISIFGHRLEHAFHHNSEKRIKHNKVHINLTRIIEQHEQIIQYVNAVNRYYFVCFSIQAPFVILMISSILLNVRTNITNYESFNGVALFIAFSFASLITLFFTAITGQELIDVSSNVFRQMYCGKWYDASISNQKALLIIMCKCMRPASISFASLFTVSSEMGATILKASMSYFTVLCSLQ